MLISIALGVLNTIAIIMLSKLFNCNMWLIYGLIAFGFFQGLLFAWLFKKGML